MQRIPKDQYYLDIAAAVSRRSTCLRRHYGAVIVNHDEIIATGYNGSPRGEDNCCDIHLACPRMGAAHNSGDYSDCPAVHAEQNAMLSADRQSMIGSTLYLNGYKIIHTGTGWEEEPLIKSAVIEPCPICERMIRNAGIKKVITPDIIIECED